MIINTPIVWTLLSDYIFPGFFCILGIGASIVAIGGIYCFISEALEILKDDDDEE